MTINNKSERNYRGKCLGWPVTSYGAAKTDFVSGGEALRDDPNNGCGGD